MLRISQSKPALYSTIRLEGKLLGPWVEEVRSTVEALRSDTEVCLSLEGLSFADADGIELLRALRRRGVPLVGGSGLIEGLLAQYFPAGGNQADGPSEPVE